MVNLITGITMVSVRCHGLLAEPGFKIKMALLLLAGLNALWFTVAEHRHVLSLPSDRKTSVLVRTSAALSLLVWFGVIYWGRMIVAFLASSASNRRYSTPGSGFLAAASADGGGC